VHCLSGADRPIESALRRARVRAVVEKYKHDSSLLLNDGQGRSHPRGVIYHESNEKTPPAVGGGRAGGGFERAR
jgi:hypothetical protein